MKIGPLSFAAMLLATGVYAGGNTVPVKDKSGVDYNFRELDSEVRKVDMRNGGTITGSLTQSSGTQLAGPTTFYQTVNITSAAVLSGPLVTQSSFTVGGGIFGHIVVQSTMASLSLFQLGEDVGTVDRSPLVVAAKSVDGVSESSGCLVAVQFDGANETNSMVFTSTNVAGVANQLGVLMESCSVGSVCRVAITGIVRVQTAAAVAVNGVINTSGVRCQTGDGTAAFGSNTQGKFLSASTGAGAWAWAMMGY